MTRERDHQGGRHGGRQQSTTGRQDQRDDYRRSLRDTYNPEPQWLRQDRESRGWGSDEADEYGQGRGRYAGGGDQPQGREQSRDYQGRDYQGRGYQAQDDQRQADQERGDRQREFGGRQSSEYRRNEPSQSRQGTQFTGRQEYGSGFETSGWDDDLDLSESQGRYEPFHVGTGMGLGPAAPGRGQFGRTYGTSSGYGGGFGSSYGTWGDDDAARQRQAGSHRDAPQYGGRSGYDLGTHQRDIRREPQRSFRGLGPKDYKRPDDRIRDDIYERLTDDHHIDARAIMVEVNQGNVTLTGTVIERRMRYAAEDLVESVMGVANINNQLRVQQENPSGASMAGGSESPTGDSPSGASSTETKRH